MLDYIKDHWNGNLPLWKAYWIGNILVIFAAVAGGFLFGATLAIILPAMAPATYSLLGMIFVGWPLTAWLMVGVWRSATVWTAENPRKFWVWGRVAQFMVILGIIQVVLQMAAV